MPYPNVVPHRWHGVATAKPSGLLALLLRAPTVLYALGLGWLLGGRFVELTHRGRRSGLIHWTVVEVTRFDRATREVIVMSAWHGRTDWYRNIQAEPALEVRLGRLRFVPEQRLLDAAETVREMRDYLRRYPFAVRLLPVLFGIDPRGPEAASREAIAEFFKGVAFRPARR